MSGNPNDTSENSDRNPPFLKLIDSCLRICVVPLSVASIWLTVTNRQDNPSYGKLEYGSIMGLRYMVCISAICAGYALATAVSSWFKHLGTRAWLFFVPDQVVAYVLVTSVSAISEIVYLAYRGDQEVTWSEACSSYGVFCSRLKIALVLHGLALGCFVVLAVISAYRVFSIFEPPCVATKEVEVERN